MRCLLSFYFFMIQLYTVQNQIFKNFKDDELFSTTFELGLKTANQRNSIDYEVDEINYGNPYIYNFIVCKCKCQFELELRKKE